MPRLAGLFASVSFLTVASGGLYATMNPLQSLIYGVLTAVVVGLIGHRMGYIVSHPDKKHRRHQQQEQIHRSSGLSDPLDFKPTTGEAIDQPPTPIRSS